MDNIYNENTFPEVKKFDFSAAAQYIKVDMRESGIFIITGRLNRITKR